MNTVNINELSTLSLIDTEQLLVCSDNQDYLQTDLPAYDFNGTCNYEEQLQEQIEQLIAYIEELEGVRL